MTVQRELNEMRRELCNLHTTNWKFNLVTLIILFALIGFSIHGWLCMENIIRGNKEFCNISFTIAVALEVMVVIFVIVPLCISILINCIYTRLEEAKLSTLSPLSSLRVQRPLRVHRSNVSNV